MPPEPQQLIRPLQNPQRQLDSTKLRGNGLRPMLPAHSITKKIPQETTSVQTPPRNANRQATNPPMYSNVPMMNGGYGYGGYGMGMGAYGMGMMGMGAMGMANSFASGPLSIIYSINYFIAMASQIFAMLGMNSHALMQLFSHLKATMKSLEHSILHSEFRRWIVRKSKKSKLFRFLLVMSSILLSSQAFRLVKYLIMSHFRSKLATETISNKSESNLLSSS